MPDEFVFLIAPTLHLELHEIDSALWRDLVTSAQRVLVKGGAKPVGALLQGLMEHQFLPFYGISVDGEVKRFPTWVVAVVDHIAPAQLQLVEITSGRGALERCRCAVYLSLCLAAVLLLISEEHADIGIGLAMESTDV